MTQVGEGQEAAETAPPLMTSGVPAVGEILAERYRLEEHVNNDSAGRQVWRGVDVVLRRPVAVVLRYPGGDSATEMLHAAVTASRVVHANLVGVYDAIDEHERAYVVREWVEGAALREHVSDGPLEPARATAVAHSVASAVAAVHATDMVHGNIHPGTVLIATDGRVVLADARADGLATPEDDVRAVGGILYFALTGHWPHDEAGRSSLPDAVRDTAGGLTAPRQVRAGVPSYLDDLAMDLLDRRLNPPSADALAAELNRLNEAQDQFLDEVGPLRFAGDEQAAAPRPAGRKVAFGVTGLLAIAVVGLLIGINALSSGTEPTGGQRPGRPGAAAPDGGHNIDAGKPHRLALTADQLRIVDPPRGKRDELGGVDKMVDGDLNTGWETDHYRTSRFGGLKPGMGVLIKLDEPQPLTSIQVDLSVSGATAQLKYGTADPGNTSAGDEQITKTFQAVGDEFRDHDGTRMVFGAFDPNTKYQYLLIWITDMPQDGDKGYQIGVNEIVVQAS